MLNIALIASPSRSAQTRTERIHINQPSANDSRYFYVPFEMPANASRLHVSYEYDRANGANTLDLGVFDARFSGRDDDSRGFRGWSGGSRSEFFITADEATPAYLPGALTAGTWRIIFGLYRVAPAGVDVEITITIETNNNGSTNLPPTPRTASHLPTRAAMPVSAALPAERRTPLSISNNQTRRWLRGDLHTHTVHSDGTWTIPQLYEAARAENLDFISITEHNTSSHHAEIDRLFNADARPLVMRGEEVTTYNGHANAWGLPSGAWLDFRVRRGDERRMNEIVTEAHRQGALISINHPTALCGGCDWTYSTDSYDAIEVWNGRWDAEDERALVMWDRMLRAGRRIAAIGSSDTHRPNNQTNAPARPTTHVAADALSERALLEAIRAGRVFVTSEPNNLSINFGACPVNCQRAGRSSIGEELRIPVSGVLELFLTIEALPPDATVHLISNNGRIQSYAAVARRRVSEQVRLNARELPVSSFYRVEVRDGAGAMLLFTNPIYVTVQGTTRAARSRS